MAIGSPRPGHSRVAGMTGDAIPDTGIRMEHRLHEFGGSNGGVAVETRSRCRGVVERAEYPPACAARGMTLPAILTATVNDGGPRQGIGYRRRSIAIVALQATDACERRVVGNPGLTQGMNRLG